MMVIHIKFLLINLIINKIMIIATEQKYSDKEFQRMA